MHSHARTSAKIDDNLILYRSLLPLILSPEIARRSSQKKELEVSSVRLVSSVRGCFVADVEDAALGVPIHSKVPGAGARDDSHPYPQAIRRWSIR